MTSANPVQPGATLPSARCVGATDQFCPRPRTASALGLEHRVGRSREGVRLLAATQAGRPGGVR